MACPVPSTIPRYALSQRALAPFLLSILAGMDGAHAVAPSALGEILAAVRYQGEAVRHRTTRHLNTHLAQDHRGIKQRIQPMGGFKSVEAATRFCRAHAGVRNFLRPRSRRNEVISLAHRRLLYTARTRVLLTSLAAAEVNQEGT